MKHDECVEKELPPPLVDPNALLPQRVAAFRKLYSDSTATDDAIQAAILAVDVDINTGRSVVSDPKSTVIRSHLVATKLQGDNALGTSTATAPPSPTPDPSPRLVQAAPVPTPTEPPIPPPTPSPDPLGASGGPAVDPGESTEEAGEEMTVKDDEILPPASSSQDETLGKGDEVAPTRQEPPVTAPAVPLAAQPLPATQERTTRDKSAPTPPRTSTSTTRPTTARGGGGDKGWIFAFICLVIGLVTAGTCARNYYKTAPTTAVPTAATPSVASSAIAPPTAAPSATALASATTTPTAAPSSLPAGWINLPRRTGRTCPQSAPLARQMPLAQRRQFFDEDVDAVKMTATKTAWDGDPTRNSDDLVWCHSPAGTDGSQNLANCQVCQSDK